MTDDIPQDMRDFVAENLTSIGQLRVLLLLHERLPREWTGAVVAQELYMSVPEAEQHLAALAGRGLTVLTETPAAVYHYAPSAAARDLIARLVQLDRERPVTLVNLVYARNRSL